MTEFIIEATDHKGKRRILSIKTCDKETAIAYFETEYDWKLENITDGMGCCQNKKQETAKYTSY